MLEKFLSALGMMLGIVAMAFGNVTGGLILFSISASQNSSSASTSRFFSYLALGLGARGIVSQVFGFSSGSFSAGASTEGARTSLASVLIAAGGALGAQSVDEAKEERGEEEKEPEQSERNQQFDAAVSIAITKAKHTRDQFKGEPAGSYVIEDPVGFFSFLERLTTRYERVNERFRVSRGSTLVPLDGFGEPMTNNAMSGIPRKLAAVALAPRNLDRHVTKLEQLRREGGYTSAVETTIRNVEAQIRTIEKFILDKGL